MATDLNHTGDRFSNGTELDDLCFNWQLLSQCFWYCRNVGRASVDHGIRVVRRIRLRHRSAVDQVRKQQGRRVAYKAPADMVAGEAAPVIIGRIACAASFWCAAESLCEAN